MQVQVIQVPGTIKSVTLNFGASVRDAISAAGVNLSGGETLKVNGLEATVDAALNDGDKLMIAKGAKGNSKIVTNPTLVYGRDVETLSEDELFATARKVRAEIDQLTKDNIGIDSTKIAARIVEASEGLQKVKDLLDAKK